METMTESNIDPIQAELNRTKALVASLRNVLDSLQSDLADWAESNLAAFECSYDELHELMQNNGLEGLKRKYTVTVHVNYTFEVEVEATSEDEARDLVDNDVYDYIRDNIDLSYYDDVDIEATEA